MSTVLLKLIWALATITALVFLTMGLSALVYFEPTGEAIAEAHRGTLLVIDACAALVLSAVLAIAYLPAPMSVGIALLAPVLICGGLTLTMSESLLPQLGIVVAYPIALSGLLVGLFTNAGRPSH